MRRRHSNASSSIASSSASGANLNATVTNVAPAGLGAGQPTVDDGEVSNMSTENIVVDYR